MYNKKIVFVCLAGVYVSCISTKALLIDPSMDSLPEVDPTNLRIIVDETDLEELDYVKVAMIESHGQHQWRAVRRTRLK